MPRPGRYSGVCRTGDYYEGQHDSCETRGCECECHVELQAEVSEPPIWKEWAKRKHHD